LFSEDDDDDDAEGKLPAVVLTGHRGMSRVAYAMAMSVLVLTRTRRFPGFEYDLTLSVAKPKFHCAEGKFW